MPPIGSTITLGGSTATGGPGGLSEYSKTDILGNPGPGDYEPYQERSEKNAYIKSIRKVATAAF
jgi:hypothetical protein